MDPMEFLVKRGLDCKSKQALILKDKNGETVFCCSECPQRYTEKELMELHLCMHNKEYRFICSICGRGLKRKEHLERHTLEHQEVRPHPCPECGKAFKRKEHLNIHRNIHSTYRDHVCPLCSKTFHRKDHLQKHMQIHSKDLPHTEFVEVSHDDDGSQSQNEVSQSGYSHEDDVDDAGSQNGFSYDEEIDIKEEPLDYEPVHSTIDVDTLLKLQGNVPALLETSMQSEDPARPFACCICLKTFKRKDHLKLHNYSHMKKDKICSECGKGFHKQEQLLVHMGQHVTSRSLLQGELQARGSVQWEDIEDSDESSLLQPIVRISSVSVPESRPHACPVCGKRFKRRQHLKVHAHTHERKQLASIWCSICNAGFYSNESFESHACLSNGNGDSENNLQGSGGAPAGARAAAAPATRGEGENTVEAISPEDELGLPVPRPVRVFVCRACGKQFRRKDHYKIHLNVHTGVKTLFCPYCAKGFYRKDHMQKHIQVHEKKKKVKRIPELLPMAPRALTNKIANFLNLPEITIHAPANSKLRLPLKMKVPYQVVTSSASGETEAVVVHPAS